MILEAPKLLNYKSGTYNLTSFIVCRKFLDLGVVLSRFRHEILKMYLNIALLKCRPALWGPVISGRSSVLTLITCLSVGSTTTGSLILVVSGELNVLNCLLH